jgi:NADH-quinone oxidoreductase subunit H
MKLGWKVLLPASLIWIVMVAGMRLLFDEGGIDRDQFLIWGGAALAALVVASVLIPERQAEEREEIDMGDDVPPTSPFPVPPLPGQEPVDVTASVSDAQPPAVDTSQEEFRA